MTAVTPRSAGGLRTARERTLALVAPYSDDVLERQLSAVEALDYMAAVRERTLAVLDEGGESFEHELVARGARRWTSSPISRPSARSASWRCI